MIKFLAPLILVPVAIVAVASVAHADEPAPTSTTVAACVDEYHGPDGAVEEIPCDQWTNCGGLVGGWKVPTKYYPARCPAPTTTTSAPPPAATVPLQGQCPDGQYDPHPEAPPPHTCLPLPSAETPAPTPGLPPVVEETTTTEAAPAPVSAPTRKKPARQKAATTTTTTATVAWPVEVWLYLW